MKATTSAALAFIAAGVDAKPWGVRVTVHGARLWLTRGGAIAPPDHVSEDGEIASAGVATAFGQGTSFAHLFPDGVVLRFGVLIATEADIVFGWESLS